MKNIDYQKQLRNNGDIIEYSLVWEKDRDSFVIQTSPTLDEEALEQVIKILKKYNIVEFKANLQLQDNEQP
jgi:hypothetical protein